MKRPYDIVLFDLDGTLCETGEGIRNSIRHALGEMEGPSLQKENCVNLSARHCGTVSGISAA